MGRGNVCVHGDYEGLYYIDYENYIDEDELSYHPLELGLEDDLHSIATDFCSKFKSFIHVQEKRIWVDREKRLLAENELFQLVVEDNEWSAAIMLIQKEDEWCEPSKQGLQKRHFDNYFEGLKEILFCYYEELGVYAGAWTSGRIQKGEEN